MKRESQPVTIESIKRTHTEKRGEIQDRLAEFSDIWKLGSDSRLWEEMVYCFFTGGCSARMGLRSIEAVRHLIGEGTREDLAAALTGVHRFPNARAAYITASREFLKEHCGMRLRKTLMGFSCGLDRRDWLVKEKRIKGLAYKESSHFLRNIGLPGYAILDKHVLGCMAELGIISETKPPKARAKYLIAEQALKKFADLIEIDFDELDLVLWSMKTGEILK